MPAPDLLGTFEKPVEWTLKTILAPGPTLPVLFIMICTGIRKLWQGRGNSKFGLGTVVCKLEQLQLPADDLSVPGWEHVGDKPLKLDKETSKMIRKAFRVLGTAIRKLRSLAQRNQKKHANKNVLSNGTLFHYLRQKASEDKSDGGGENERTACAVLCIFVLTFYFRVFKGKKVFDELKLDTELERKIQNFALTYSQS